MREICLEGEKREKEANSRTETVEGEAVADRYCVCFDS